MALYGRPCVDICCLIWFCYFQPSVQSLLAFYRNGTSAGFLTIFTFMSQLVMTSLTKNWLNVLVMSQQKKISFFEKKSKQKTNPSCEIWYNPHCNARDKIIQLPDLLCQCAIECGVSDLHSIRVDSINSWPRHEAHGPKTSHKPARTVIQWSNTLLDEAVPLLNFLLHVL